MQKAWAVVLYQWILSPAIGTCNTFNISTRQGSGVGNVPSGNNNSSISIIITLHLTESSYLGPSYFNTITPYYSTLNFLQKGATMVSAMGITNTLARVFCGLLNDSSALRRQVSSLFMLYNLNFLLYSYTAYQICWPWVWQTNVASDSVYGIISVISSEQSVPTLTQQAQPFRLLVLPIVCPQ